MQLAPLVLKVYKNVLRLECFGSFNTHFFDSFYFPSGKCNVLKLLELLR
jgi:hypothetical protein